MGSSKTNSSYSFGKCVQDTCLRLLTWAINDGYLRGPGNGNATLSDTTYNNLISIGAGNIEALGNAKPPTYIVEDPSGVWTTTSVAYGTQQGISSLPGPATSGYPVTGNTGQGQEATWYPYNSTNPNRAITQWGWIRCHALQAWNEFNWNGTTVDQSTPEYKEFCSSFMTYAGFINSANQVIMAQHNAESFMNGTYSNMSDLISADVAGVNLASKEFGSDLAKLGKAINLKKIDSFGLPSNLLAILGKNAAITQDLALVLLSTGLTRTEIDALSSGLIEKPAKELEQKIYGSFLVITGSNLTEVLAPIQCTTQGFESLADLLNVKKMFPSSYASLTVPKYNGQVGLPTNSKTYYPIYQGGGVNSALTSTEMNEYVGYQIPKGPPPTTKSTANPKNYSLPIKGFGTYLRGILPDDQATAAGALSFTLRQIPKIDQVDFKKFAKAVAAMENVTDLPLVAGTSKPTNQAALDTTKIVQAIGSGPYGTYTFSDVFGCMSGLPYPWEKIYDRITQLQTSTLSNIYQNLYLAVTWEGAVLAYTLANSSPSNYYIDTLSIVTPGGGYSRGGADAPTISLPFGASATCTIGTDPNNITTFGRLTSVTLVSGGSHSNNSGWYANIECPPTSNGGGTNTASGTTGWTSPMNSVVQNYIDQANTEIAAIAIAQPNLANILNTYWNGMGAQLKVEQRSRYIGISPVSVPKDLFANPYPNTINTFVDSIPTFAQDTKPHMSAQTIEAISDTTTVGGQSAIAQQRQERNQRRMQDAGMGLDNNIPNNLSSNDQKTLTTNGTLPGATNNGINGYTNPAWPRNQIDGVVVYPQPQGIYVPNDAALVGTFIPSDSTVPGDITPILDGLSNPVVNSLVPTGPTSAVTIRQPVIIQPPAQLDPSNVPSNLDPNYTSSTLLPAAPSVQAAIENVINCNCDCWIR